MTATVKATLKTTKGKGQQYVAVKLPVQFASELSKILFRTTRFEGPLGMDCEALYSALFRATAGTYTRVTVTRFDGSIGSPLNRVTRPEPVAPAKPKLAVGDKLRDKALQDVPIGTELWDGSSKTQYIRRVADGWDVFDKDGTFRTYWTLESAFCARKVKALAPSLYAVGQSIHLEADYAALPVGTEVWYNTTTMAPSKWWTKAADGLWHTPSRLSGSRHAGSPGMADTPYFGRKIKSLP